MTRKDYISLAIINRRELDSVDLNSVKMNLQSSTVNCIQTLRLYLQFFRQIFLSFLILVKL